MAAVAVLRESITELCVADHQNDPETLDRWLRNKTIEHFHCWLADPSNFLVVATIESVVLGIALVDVRGDIRLCYVRPGRERQGIGRAMLRALEAQACQWRLKEVRLGSSLNARGFYEHHGYRFTGESAPAFGVVTGYGYVKAL